LAKETFREWWSKDSASRLFLFELKVGRKLFEEWHLPLIVEKLAVQKVIQVEGEEEWKEKKTLFLLPSLFPEAMLFLLWGISEKTAWEIKEKFSVPPFFFLAFLRKVEERKWNDVPWVVIEPDEQALRKIWYSRAQKFDVSLSKAGEKKLFHFLERYDLGMSDVEDFFAYFAGQKELGGEEVAFFFERDEKVLLFRFLDALGKRDKTGAFHYLQMLWRADFSPSWLIAQIARRFRLLLQVYEGGGTTHDLWQGKELHPFEAEKIEAMKEKYRLPEVHQAFTLLRTADRLTKTQNIDPKIVLARVIEEMMTPPAPGSVFGSDET